MLELAAFLFWIFAVTCGAGFAVSWALDASVRRLERDIAEARRRRDCPYKVEPRDAD